MHVSYEAAQRYFDIEAGLALHPNEIAAMPSIGEKVRDAYFNDVINIGDEQRYCSTEVIITQGPMKGQLVARLSKAKGCRAISRADLLHTFSALVPKENITIGKRLDVIRKVDSGLSSHFRTVAEPHLTSSLELMGIGARLKVTIWALNTLSPCPSTTTAGLSIELGCLFTISLIKLKKLGLPRSHHDWAALLL